MRYLTLLLLLALGTAANAAVYRWIDPDGNTKYGDSPPSGVVADEVDLPPLSTFSPPPAEEPATEAVEEPVEEEAVAAQPYRRMIITQPANGQTIRTDDGLVTVAVDLRPALQKKAGHRLIASVNGRRIPGQSSSIDIQVPRGSHRLQTAVIDSDGRVVARSNQITFDIRPRTRLPIPRELREIEGPGPAPPGTQPPTPTPFQAN